MSDIYVVGGGLPCGATAFDQDYFLRVLQRSFPEDYYNGLQPNGGLEVMQMFAAIGARISLANARMACSSFLLTASGGTKASGTVTFTRTDASVGTYTILAGSLVGDGTGRNFVVTSPVTISGLTPTVASVTAQYTGYAYNLPGPFTSANGETVPGAINTIVDFRTSPQVLDVTLTVAQTTSTTGGQFAALDAHGNDRNLPRVGLENDDQYRMRILTTPDTVSPGAICRGVQQILGPYGTNWCCLREVGTDKLPGWYYDAGTSTDGGAPGIPVEERRNFAWDMGARPQDTWKVFLSVAEMRAFFVVGVPPLSVYNYGFCYDGDSVMVHSPLNAYDTTKPASINAAYDGHDILAVSAYQSVYATVDAKRAAGVGFELYLETNNCQY